MKMVVSYTQARDFRWKAGEPAFDATKGANQFVIPDGTVAHWHKTDTSEGVCMALVLWWIIKHAKNEDFWTWLGPPKIACPATSFTQTLTLTETQPGEVLVPKTIQLAACGAVVEQIQDAMREETELVKKYGNGGKYMLIVDFVEKRGGLHRVSNSGFYSDSLKEFAPAAVRYVYFSIGGETQKGEAFQHGVGARIEKTNVTFFDPNVGEGTDLGIGDLKEFVGLYLPVDKYGLKKGFEVRAIGFA